MTRLGSYLKRFLMNKYEEYQEHRELAAQIAEQMAWKQSIRDSLK